MVHRTRKGVADPKAGIVCMTPENLGAPWLNFEAGALSKTVSKETVCTYLFRHRPADLTGPLVEFQYSEATKQETQKLLSTINKAVEPKPLSEIKLKESFEAWWEKLDHKLRSIPAPREGPKKAARTAEDMLEEVLAITRSQATTAQYVLDAVNKIQSRTASYSASQPFRYGLISAANALGGPASYTIPGTDLTYGQALETLLGSNLGANDPAAQSAVEAGDFGEDLIDAAGPIAPNDKHKPHKEKK